MITILENEKLEKYTTFRIGGPARYFTSVKTIEELNDVCDFAHKKKIPIFILGGGSNILFSDKGYNGIVVHLINNNKELFGDKMKVGAGSILGEVISFAADYSLSGLQNLAGVPGTLGGAVRGNAGAFGTEIKDVFLSAEVFNYETQKTEIFSMDQCNFSYRHSIFKDNQNLVILSVMLKFEHGNREEIIRIINETLLLRNKKQQQDVLSAGSFFMNPHVDDEKLHNEFFKDSGQRSRGGKLPAGWLIDYVGLRGKKIGGAQISLQHPNYLINIDRATAEDVIILSALVKRKVRDECGVFLKEEVQFVGF